MVKNELNNTGFSLVELIIVIAIMAILSAALAPQLMKYIEKSRISTDAQTCQSIKTCVQSFLHEMFLLFIIQHKYLKSQLILYLFFKISQFSLNLLDNSTVVFTVIHKFVKTIFIVKFVSNSHL